MTVGVLETALVAVSWLIGVAFLTGSWIADRAEQRRRSARFKALWKHVEAVRRAGAP